MAMGLRARGRIRGVAGRRGAAMSRDDGHAIVEAVGACTACGLCLPACPTFEATADERDGPRGRIQLMLELAEASQAPPSRQTIGDHLDRCLGCDVCSQVCPENIDFLSALQQAQFVLAQDRGPRIGAGEPRLARARAARIGALYGAHAKGLAEQARAIVEPGIRLARRVTHKQENPDPHAAGRPGQALTAGDREAQRTTRAAGREFQGPGTALTERRLKGRVLLIPSCKQRLVRPEATDAMVRLLARSGYDVGLPPVGPCCGGLAALGGLSASAEVLARDTVIGLDKLQQRTVTDPVTRGPFERVVVMGGLCVTMMERYGELFDLTGASATGMMLADGAIEGLEFLSEADIGAPVRWSALRVGVLAGCQSGAPRREKLATDLLSGAGYTVVTGLRASQCCGGSGVFPALAPDFAAELSRDMADRLARAEIDVLGVDDASCLGALAPRMRLKCVHVVELLDWAYGGLVPSGLESFAGFSHDIPKQPGAAIELLEDDASAG